MTVKRKVKILNVIENFKKCQKNLTCQFFKKYMSSKKEQQKTTNKEETKKRTYFEIIILRPEIPFSQMKFPKIPTIKIFPNL